MNDRVEAKITIGRGSACDVVLGDETVSRLHARLEVLGGGRIRLTDLDSRNGTSVIRGGHATRITEVWVSENDLIQLGAHRESVGKLLARAGVKPRTSPPTRKRLAEAKEFTSLAQGSRLVRCAECGAVKRQAGPCHSCGR